MIISSFVEKFGVLISWLIGTSLIFLRYLLFAGLAYGFFYCWKKKDFIHLKIQKQFPKNSQIRTELLYSILSVMIFAALGFLIFQMNKIGLTQMYQEIDKFGYSYLLVSLVIMIFLHDTYFYWTHRLMHHPRLFKIFHQVHHYSPNPTPWAAFAFHPLEAMVEFAIVPIAVFLLPMHPVVIVTWSIWSVMWNVVGHLGYEMLPPSFASHSLFKWLNTSTHHNLHHAHSRGNYSLYFNLWDRWMKTNDKNYEEVFVGVKGSVE
jgi:Delta7-sterol 5-desaturase